MCARSRSRRPRQEHRASGSRHHAHVRDLSHRTRQPAPLRPSGTTDPLTMRTCALYGHSRAPLGAVSTSGRDDGLPPPVPRPPSPREPSRDRGSSPPDRSDCPWYTARPISGCDRPGQWHNQPDIIGHPQEGPCANLRRRAAQRGRHQLPEAAREDSVLMSTRAAPIAVACLVPVVLVSTLGCGSIRSNLGCRMLAPVRWASEFRARVPPRLQISPFGAQQPSWRRTVGASANTFMSSCRYIGHPPATFVPETLTSPTGIRPSASRLRLFSGTGGRTTRFKGYSLADLASHATWIVSS